MIWRFLFSFFNSEEEESEEFNVKGSLKYLASYVPNLDSIGDKFVSECIAELRKCSISAIIVGSDQLYDSQI